MSTPSISAWPSTSTPGRRWVNCFRWCIPRRIRTTGDSHRPNRLPARAVTMLCVADVSWHSERMAGRDKDIERIRAKSALEVIRQHPVLVLFAVSPVLALLAATWWLIGASWAISGAVVLLLASAAFIVFRS